MLAPLVLAAVVGYLLGSLPFGYLVARAKGVNIFEVGSKNPGATNVRRVLGSGPGNLVLILDLLKGVLAAGWLRWFWLVSPGNQGAADNFKIGLVGLVFAILGHSFSCFTRFRGGKGVATAAGGFLVLFPQGALVAAVVWGLTVAVTRYVSLASMLAGVGLTLTAWFLHTSALVFGTCVAVTIFVIARHRANISRLLAGTENKVGQKPEAPKP
jgi:glycerol-3-phosphate acyltransferase PlsY